MEEQYSYQEPQKEPPKQNNVLAIVGMILGIISIPVGCCGWYSFFFGIGGLVCSILSRKQEKTGMSVAGIVCSIIGIVIALLMLLLTFVVLGLLASEPELQKLLQIYGM